MCGSDATPVLSIPTGKERHDELLSQPLVGGAPLGHLFDEGIGSPKTVNDWYPATVRNASSKKSSFFLILG